MLLICLLITTTQKMHFTMIQNTKMQPMKRKGKMEESITLRIKLLESNTERFKSFTKQSMERNTVVTSVVCLTGLKIEVTLSGSLKFMLMETDTI